ncbi:histone chaperone asf1-like [Ctenocephalides felis]|uniref:histone chaperone asf1-like n=1 Tax=Ctenocephalides felis TaxID=7515 RepID=UPI000E6E1684|nr:histone chaperone asf1-like [Ctenocephalides felis]XP_026466828.1 histone chaperone asf1-like [Ctenocephalides felis]
MAKIQLTDVRVLDNPSAFLNPFQFELTFECIEELKEDLEWKMIYVGSAETEEHDQVLDTIYVGPIPEGRHMFVFQADPPDVTRIPEKDAVGVTVVLLTCSYRNQEFIRVGYFINNDYNESEQELRETPPAIPQYDKIVRNILETQPRVTRFQINWDDNSTNGCENPNAFPESDVCDNITMDSSTTDDTLQMSASVGFNENSNSIAAMEC